MAKSTGGVSVIEAPETRSDPPAEKRLNLILSAGAYSDLAKMASLRRTTMTEIVRLALGLLKVAISEVNANHKLVVTTEDGKVLKELILPG
jgi:hypothetical protein